MDPDYPVFDSPFSDVSYGSWYYDAVAAASDLGVMNGYGDGTFGPDDPLTREQAAGVLYNYLGEKDVSSPSAPHDDVTQGQWYSSAVNWAIAENIMGGYGGSSLFGIGDPLTREQFATIIANAAGEDVSEADRSVLERYPGATIARNIRARQRAACRMAGHSYCQAPSYPFSILSRLNAGSFSSDGRCVTDETPPLPPSMITEMSLLWVQWAKQAQTGGGQRCCGVMRNFPMRPQSPTQS